MAQDVLDLAGIGATSLALAPPSARRVAMVWRSACTNAPFDTRAPMPAQRYDWRTRCCAPPRRRRSPWPSTKRGEEEVSFLSDQQLAEYGRFAGVPSRSDLERYFFLDDADLYLVNKRRPDTHRLGLDGGQ